MVNGKYDPKNPRAKVEFDALAVNVGAPNWLQDMRMARASQVVSVFLEGEDELEFDLSDPRSFTVMKQWKTRMDEAIKLHLDHASIADFVSLILEQRIRMSQASKAQKRHSDNRASKEKVFAWCEENMKRFKSMDDAALDIADTFVPHKFRTVRQWMTEWKKRRSPGRA